MDLAELVLGEALVKVTACGRERPSVASQNEGLEIMTIAAWIALITLFAVLYDLLWRQRPRMRMRIRTWKESTRLDLTFINRGGASYTVLDVIIQIQGSDGSFPKVGLDAEPIDVPPFGARTIVLDTPNRASGSILVETVPMGERWFALPAPGWLGQQPRWLAQKWRGATGWGRVPKGVSR